MFMNSENSKISELHRQLLNIADKILHLEITEVVLVHCNIVNNDYQHKLRVLYIFVLNKSFGQLIHISRKTFIFSKAFNSGFSYVEVWFTDQNPKLLEIEE